MVMWLYPQIRGRLLNKLIHNSKGFVKGLRITELDSGLFQRKLSLHRNSTRMYIRIKYTLHTDRLMHSPLSKCPREFKSVMMRSYHYSGPELKVKNNIILFFYSLYSSFWEIVLRKWSGYYTLGPKCVRCNEKKGGIILSFGFMYIHYAYK